MNSSKIFGFIQIYNQPIKEIKTKGTIINPINNKTINKSDFIWDTGATNSAINTDIIKELNLPVRSVTEKLVTASDEISCYNYHIGIVLPNNLTIKPLLVNGLPLGKGVSILIGMDIIQKGSFLLTKDKKGKDIFEFCIPFGHSPICK